MRRSFMFTRVLLLSSVIIAASFAQGAQPPQPTNTQAAPSAQTTPTKTQASQPAATQGVPPSQPTAPMLTAQAGPSMPPSVPPNPAAAGPGPPAIAASGSQMVQADVTGLVICTNGCAVCKFWRS